ncbi:hypothetical protein BJ165DRAFT_618731 [Panaeolus papilionaceus]|nr:hypothetical protein BJ165DRAFT_618731 [Panaeolus papilionaceus]
MSNVSETIETGPVSSGIRLFESSRALVSGGHFTQTSRDSASTIVHNYYYGPGLPTQDTASTDGDTPSSTDPDPVAPTVLCPIPMPTQIGLDTQRTNQIYEKYMLSKARGYPLWITECSMGLHIEKRRLGVCVGDVGLITRAGGFSFLFNILLPINHPIQPRRMPEGFVPAPPIDPADIMTVEDLSSNSCLTSVSIRRLEVERLDPPSSGVEQVFELTSSEGAVLALPDGAISSDMENLRAWKKYMASHIESWYRYVNGRLGREAENGDIRLVVGVDKTSSWGMAVAGPGQQALNTQPSRLRFRPSMDDDSPVKHKWDCTGVVETRAGPRQDVIQQLFSDATNQVVPVTQNQCIFIRTLNATLSEDTWDGIDSKIGTVWGENQRSSRPSEGFNAVHSPGKGRGTSSGYSHIASWTGSHSYVTGGMHGENIPGRLYTENHPGDNLNKILLTFSPRARVAITSDYDWHKFKRDINADGFDWNRVSGRIAMKILSHDITITKDGGERR